MREQQRAWRRQTAVHCGNLGVRRECESALASGSATVHHSTAPMMLHMPASHMFQSLSRLLHAFTEAGVTNVLVCSVAFIQCKRKKKKTGPWNLLIYRPQISPEEEQITSVSYVQSLLLALLSSPSCHFHWLCLLLSSFLASTQKVLPGVSLSTRFQF